MNRALDRKAPRLPVASFALIAGLAFLGGCTTSSTPAASSECSQGVTIAGCSGPAIGFSCPSGATPPTDTSLSCGAGSAGSSGETLYCCSSTGPACSADPSVTGCAAGLTGYACTGGQTPPESDAALVCGAGVVGPHGALDYCCTAAGACVADANVTGCTGGSKGYSCTGAQTPPQTNAALTCGPAVAGVNGVADYCCASGAGATCSLHDAVPGCTGNATGWSCTGADTPAQNDASFACSTGTPGGGGTLYCCVALTSSSCKGDASVAGCAAQSFGFSCTGADTPSQANASLQCGAGTPSAGATLYCCTN
jgi:hypothetical protein